MDRNADVVIVGGGLAGCLTALRLAKARPDLRLTLVEEKEKLGGHHTWSFHASDLDEASLEWLTPFISKSWDGNEVRFPRLNRSLDTRYCSIRSESFHIQALEILGDRVLFGSTASRVSESHVELANGDVIAARCILDARGSKPTAGEVPQFQRGYQKFIGKDFLLENPHGLTKPVLMDATCPQLDGFRFFYLLPWDERRLLVEETYYSDSPDLNRDRIERSIRSYAERRGWVIKETLRDESGVLPIPLTPEYIINSVGGEPLPIGQRGGYFHATTGYSLPDAVRIAETIASVEDLTTQNARDTLMRSRRSWLSRQRFYRLLNRLLFQAAEPALRYSVLQHFYEQPADLIERFYGGRTTWTDRLRIMTGRPPVPLDRAVRSFTERSVAQQA